MEHPARSMTVVKNRSARRALSLGTSIIRQHRPAGGRSALPLDYKFG